VQGSAVCLQINHSLVGISFTTSETHITCKKKSFSSYAASLLVLDIPASIRLFITTTPTSIHSVRSSYGQAITGTDGCSTFSYGETEDYLVNISSSSACSGTPAPGNTLSTNASICTGVNFTLSLQNTTLGSGVTYQWQSSSDNITYTDITGATTSTLTTNISSSTYFQCIVTCSAGPNSGTSTPVQVTINSFEGEIIANVDAKIHNKDTYTKEILVKQIASAVLWTQSLATIHNAKPNALWLEVGPGKVLQGLAKRIAQPLNKACTIQTLGDLAGLKALETFGASK